MRLVRAGNTSHCSKQPACSLDAAEAGAALLSRPPPVAHPPRHPTRSAERAGALAAASRRRRGCRLGAAAAVHLGCAAAALTGTLGQAGGLQVHLGALVAERLRHLRHAALRAHKCRAFWLGCKGMQHDMEPGMRELLQRTTSPGRTLHETRHGLRKSLCT
jgi:hypothetical protein